MNKLILNQEAIQNDLDRQWAVVAEGIQTILRREGYPKPYEALKTLTRTHKQIDRKTISEFVDGLELSEDVKQQLKGLTPMTYTGKYNY
jgi:adenylosuccinate lyase